MQNTMEQKKIDRINELAKKSEAEGLSPEEKEEQQTLRREYIAAFRASLTNELNNTFIQTPDGKLTRITKKDK